MKKWAPIHVTWFDAHGGDEGWRPLSELPTKPAEIHTVGMLARESKDVIVVILSHDPAASSHGGYIVIPRCNITELSELEVKGTI